MQVVARSARATAGLPRRHGSASRPTATTSPPSRWTCLRAELPNARFEDAGVLVNWVRAVKSDAEIALMQQAARIAERVMQTAIDAIGVGVPPCDVAAAIQAAGARGTEDYGGDYPAIVPLMPTGVGTSCPHITWLDEPFAAETGTTIEIAGVRRRYHVPMTRTVYLGTPPEKMRHAAEVVVEGIAAALAAAKPGALARDVHAAWTQHHRAARPLQGFALRLLDRPELSARLGRAHHLAPLDRRDGACSPT